ncbi:MAG: MBOAT family O-acyltransferase [Chitinophagales bacterium]|nr:MBOAT family O-acyltransferase [Chitinophagales bacterium]
MLFNSIDYVIFLPIVVFLFFSLPHQYRRYFLLAASYFFYMCWRPEYVLLIIYATTIDYFCGIEIEKTQSKRRKKAFLALSIVTNLGLLFYFKYFSFLNESTRDVFQFFDWAYNMPVLHILLPVGISFHTFQSLSYTIDVYRGKAEAEKNYVTLALFVAFFPQLVAGPIERGPHLIPQFLEEKQFSYTRMTNGLRLMMWGFFKKVVVADRAAVFVNLVYNDPNSYSGFQIIIATIFFAFQIYCDFSGYSDIAVGSARIMGYNMMYNFRRPYFATTIKEFWARWHISLSTWFRDYLYIPLGGNRVSQPRRYFNLFITFLVSGIWHGANWTFVIWGALHGFYLVFANFLKDIGLTIRLGSSKVVNLLNYFLQLGITFCLVCFGWLFFRANNVSDAFTLIKRSLSASKSQLGPYLFGAELMEDLLVLLFFIALLETIQLLQEKVLSFNRWIPTLPTVLKWSVYIAGILLILIYGKFEKTQFIYFTF